MTAIAAAPLALPRPGFVGAPEPSALLLTQAIQAIEDYAVSPVPLDVVVFRALGWTVRSHRSRDGRSPVWQAKSPLSRTWLPLPRPTRELSHAKMLVPYRWCWGVGCKNTPFAWVASRYPIVEGVTWFDSSGLSEELALTKACLHAYRRFALKREGHLS